MVEGEEVFGGDFGGGQDFLEHGGELGLQVWLVCWEALHFGQGKGGHFFFGQFVHEDGHDGQAVGGGAGGEDFPFAAAPGGMVVGFLADEDDGALAFQEGFVELASPGADLDAFFAGAGFIDEGGVFVFGKPRDDGGHHVFGGLVAAFVADEDFGAGLG